MVVAEARNRWRIAGMGGGGGGGAGPVSAGVEQHSGPPPGTPSAAYCVLNANVDGSGGTDFGGPCFAFQGGVDTGPACVWDVDDCVFAGSLDVYRASGGHGDPEGLPWLHGGLP
eukprot:6378515-Heterocapsa_arctica.AAC.1